MDHSYSRCLPDNDAARDRTDQRGPETEAIAESSEEAVAPPPAEGAALCVVIPPHQVTNRAAVRRRARGQLASPRPAGAQAAAAAASDAVAGRASAAEQTPDCTARVSPSAQTSIFSGASLSQSDDMIEVPSGGSSDEEGDVHGAAPSTGSGADSKPTASEPVAPNRPTASTSVPGDGGSESAGPDCAICLQSCMHPVQLPCKHVFCFLCVKGAAKNSKRCAMCRAEIPADYLDNPHLLNETELEREMAVSDGYQWFYEGRNGWWQYDERTSADLELAYTGGERRCELLVAGYLYVADLEAMLQLRRNDPSRRRRIKRDLASVPKKGVAGIRLEGTEGAEVGASAAAVRSRSAPLNPRAAVFVPGARSEETAAALGRLQLSQPAAESTELTQQQNNDEPRQSQLSNTGHTGPLGNGRQTQPQDSLRNRQPPGESTQRIQTYPDTDL